MSVNLAQFDRLPSIPAVAVQLLSRFSDPEVSLVEIARIVEADPALSAKLLRAANSAQFGASRALSDLGRAVGLLGRARVTSLALCFVLSEQSFEKGGLEAVYRRVWLQALVQATSAGLLGKLKSPVREADFFMTGLLAEIGELALLKATPLEVGDLIEKGMLHRDRARYRWDAIDGSPDELTIALLNRWNLPSDISEAVRGRWFSLAELRALPETPARASTHALALATSVGAYLCEAEKGYALVRINELASQLFGMTSDQTQSFLGNVQRDLRDNSQLFQIDVSSIGAQADIMAEAMEQLAQLASRGQRDPEAQAQEHLHDENSRLKQQIEELLRRNSVDALTGAFNRGHFDGQLRQFIDAAKEAGEPVGLLFLDADHFKKVNDTYGHAVGDVVLKKIAGVLMHTARRGDLVARYGGEEFVILLVNPTPEGLIALGERARGAIEREAIETGVGPLKVTISVGGAIVNPREHSNCDTLLPAVADKALYAAKRNGRNRLEIGDVVESCRASG